MWPIPSPARRAAVLFLALAPAAPLAAQQSGAGPAAERSARRVVSVTASGQVMVTPDQALLRLAVEDMAPTAARAAGENAARMQHVIRALTRLGISRQDIRTASYEIQPQYRRRPGPRADTIPPAIVGYRASNTLAVTVDSIDAVGPAIDAAIGAGANRVEGLSYGLRDPSSARLQALQRAMRSARARARALVEAIGEQLGPPLRISSNGMAPRPEFMRLQAAAPTMGAATPAQPGQLTVSATVTATFQIRRP